MFISFKYEGNSCDAQCLWKCRRGTPCLRSGSIYLQRKCRLDGVRATKGYGSLIFAIMGHNLTRVFVIISIDHPSYYGKFHWASSILTELQTTRWRHAFLSSIPATLQLSCITHRWLDFRDNRSMKFQSSYIRLLSILYTSWLDLWAV